MDIAYINTRKQGGSDALLSQVATYLIKQRLLLSGTVQTNHDRPDCHGCDMDVLVLPDGPTIRISKSLGSESCGCRLDPSALENAVVEVRRRLSQETDILILNKFGKHEAEGRGFRTLIAEALSIGVPILTAVNPLNERAFIDFSGGIAAKLPPDFEYLTNWARETSAKRQMMV